MLNYNISRENEDETAIIMLFGAWDMYSKHPSVDEIVNEINSKGNTLKKVILNVDKLNIWDTSFINFVVELADRCKNCGLQFDETTLEKGMLNILFLVRNSRKGEIENRECKSKECFKDRIKSFFREKYLVCRDSLEFLGDFILEFFAILTNKTKIRSKELLIIIEQVGVQASGIVALISFLVGLILAFISIIQLNKFGAGIYCADLVGIAMMREMGCLMTAIIMAGRTGAAFAATIGTMIVNEEVDAIKTTGLSCFRFIIMPRILALTFMMPLLCVFSDVIGMLGGMFAGVTMLDMNIAQYFSETQSAIVISDFFCGFIKSIVFAVLVAGIGCWEGLGCGRDAESVGKVTTSAVVVSITAIIIADAVFAVIFNALGI